MLEKFANIFRIPDLRKRVLFTLGILAVYRLGAFIPTPGINTHQLELLFNSQNGSALGLMDLFGGGNLRRMTIFALGIMPYITASIIFQLLTVVYEPLARIQKEGEIGRRKITQWTRYMTVILAALQSIGIAAILTKQGLVLHPGIGFSLMTVLTLTTGSGFIMWLGEQITDRGIGNGMSLLIFASILTAAPAGINAWWHGSAFEKLSLPIVVLAVVTSVVYVQEGIRKIPIQYAKRMVGRRMTSGGSTYLPLRVNMAGVIPVIFASAIMILPATIGRLLPGSWGPQFAAWFNYTSWPYIIGESLLIFAFTFFYVAVVFNSLEQADNLKKYGGFIPGIRPGRPTAQYLESVLVRLTVAGALFLAAVAAAPTLFIKFGGFSQATARALGGTSVLIVVGVAIDTMRQIESQLSMRSYKGFLK